MSTENPTESEPEGSPTEGAELRAQGDPEKGGESPIGGPAAEAAAKVPQAGAVPEIGTGPLPRSGIERERLMAILEAILFASDEPLGLKKLRDLLDHPDPKELREVLEALEQRYRQGERGFELVEVAGGYQFRTRPEHAEWVRRLKASKPTKLTRAALETLAIIAYRQPVTRPEIEEIRRVDSGAVLHTLLERGLVRILGRKDVPGRPGLYGTTKLFLEVFGLRDLSQLPALREIEDLGAEPADALEWVQGDRPEGDAGIGVSIPEEAGIDEGERGTDSAEETQASEIEGGQEDRIGFEDEGTRTDGEPTAAANEPRGAAGTPADDHAGKPLPETTDESTEIGAEGGRGMPDALVEDAPRAEGDAGCGAPTSAGNGLSGSDPDLSGLAVEPSANDVPDPEDGPDGRSA